MANTGPSEGFSVNARCLAFHGPLLYESKILKTYLPNEKNAGIDIEEIPEENRAAVAYLVHYKGWKSSWDEWLPQERVLRWTEENLRMQKELKSEALQQLRSKKTGGSGQGESTQQGGNAVALSSQKRKEATKEHPEAAARGTKKTRREADEKDDEYLSHLDVNIIVPDVLKAQLVDDWESVTKNSQLVKLPRSPNIQEILQEFRTFYLKRRLGNAETEILDEVLAGLQLYFDKSLGSILLYRFERQQYLELTRGNPGKVPSEIYGAEHLVRLFVSLPGLLSHTHMDQQSINVLKAHIEELLRFLAKNQKSYFVESYINSTPAYEAISRGL
ncbi:MRG-domain-containing protein [Lipomyces orientalis]|uniref:MRG-domain-containing protein n=1 Tax=Lipomyces orientalis TaxID=1233043 RepID=A0ACC3TTT9_9ASCO